MRKIDFFSGICHFNYFNFQTTQKHYSTKIKMLTYWKLITFERQEESS